MADDKNLLLAAATCCIIVKQQSQKRRRRRRFWIHPVLQERRQQGDYLHLIQELRDDPALFQRYFGLSVAQFDVVLELLRPDIQLQNTRWRSNIDPGQQLAITLRYSFLILFTFKIDSFLWHDAFAQRGLCRGKMSVRLSVSHTPVLSLNVIHILKVFFPPSGSPTFLVFPYQTGCQYSDRDPLTRASNVRGVCVTFGRLAVSDSELGVDVIDFDECYCYLFTVLYCSLFLHAGSF